MLPIIRRAGASLRHRADYPARGVVVLDLSKTERVPVEHSGGKSRNYRLRGEFDELTRMIHAREIRGFDRRPPRQCESEYLATFT